MKSKLLYFVTLLLVFASGCSKDKEKETILNIVETYFNITDKGGTGIIIVETNAELNAESNAGWCSAVVSGKQVNISVDANNGLTSRTATITLSAGDKTERVPVTQEGAKQPTRILTYEELLGDYTLTAKLGEEWYYEGTTFTSTLHLEPLEEDDIPYGVAYKATIDGYMPDEAFLGYYFDGGWYEQYPLIFFYENGNLIIPNGLWIATDIVELDEEDLEELGDIEFDEDVEFPIVIAWAVLYFAVSSEGDISGDDNLYYVGRWNESLNQPVFTFSNGDYDPDFQVIGFLPYWWNIEPDDEEFDDFDPGLFLYDWKLTKKEPIP